MAAPNPFQAPQTELPPGSAPEVEPLVYCRESTRWRILQVALWQRYLLVGLAIFMVVILSHVFFFDQEQLGRYRDSGYFQGALVIGSFSFVLHGFYKLAASLHARHPVLLTLLLVTIVGMLLVPIYSYRATQFLRSFGFDVGWYGASPGKLAKLIRVIEG